MFHLFFANIENSLVQLQDAAFYGIKVYVAAHISIKKHTNFFFDDDVHDVHDDVHFLNFHLVCNNQIFQTQYFMQCILFLKKKPSK